MNCGIILIADFTLRVYGHIESCLSATLRAGTFVETMAWLAASKEYTDENPNS